MVLERRATAKKNCETSQPSTTLRDSVYAAWDVSPGCSFRVHQYSNVSDRFVSPGKIAGFPSTGCENFGSPPLVLPKTLAKAQCSGLISSSWETTYHVLTGLRSVAPKGSLFKSKFGYLQLRHGSPPTTSNQTQIGTHRLQFGLCPASRSQPGRWSNGKCLQG